MKIMVAQKIRAAEAAPDLLFDFKKIYAGEGFPGAIPGVLPGSGFSTCCTAPSSSPFCGITRAVKLLAFEYQLQLIGIQHFALQQSQGYADQWHHGSPG